MQAGLSVFSYGQNDYMVAVVRNISDEIKFENRLKKSNSEIIRLTKIISKNVLMTTSDLYGNITYVSKAMLDFTGYENQELVGKNHRIFKSERDQSSVFKELWETIESDQKWEGELENRKKDGTKFWVKLIIKPVYVEGKKTGYTAIKENITDKKRLNT